MIITATTLWVLTFGVTHDCYDCGRFFMEDFYTRKQCEARAKELHRFYDQLASKMTKQELKKRGKVVHSCNRHSH